MEYRKAETINLGAVDRKRRSIFIKASFIFLLISTSYAQVIAQASSDTMRLANTTIYLLPDGSVFAVEKWDSLEQAWGKGRIMLQHNSEDDAKGIMHLVRLTDEMIQQAANGDKENEKLLNTLLSKPAPDFELADVQGKRWSLKKLRGKVVVLNFWFTSCAPCIQEMPELNKLVNEYSSGNIVFLALAFNNTNEVKKFLQKHTFNYTLLPNSQQVDQKYHISSWPTSIVISKKGDIKKIVQSSTAIKEELQAVISTLL